MGTFIQADVAAVHASHVVLDKATTLQEDQNRMGSANSPQSESDKLPYDYLAICTGSSYSNPANKAGSAVSLKDRKGAVQVSINPRGWHQPEAQVRL